MKVVDWISKQAGKLADKFDDYKFYVKSSPDRLDSSTRLFLNSYTSRDQEALVPCIYKWSRIKNGILTEATEFKGNTFLCEPADVGCTIQVEVTSIDEQYPGTATLKFGPVQIDVLLKQSIQNALSTGESKYQVDIGHGDRTKQCTLHVSDDYMKIAHCNSSSHFRFYYCLGQPLINALSKDPTNIEIVFPPKYQSQTLSFLSQLWSDITITRQQFSQQQLTISLRFINRRCKDEFLFSMKGFIAKKQLKNSSIIKKIQKLDIDDNNINFMLQIQSLRKDLLRLFNLNKKSQQQKKVYMQQTLKLQKQIEDIISSYTKLIEGKFRTKEEFQESFIDFENKKDHAITHKLKKIEEENQRLKTYIKEKIQGEQKDTYINQLKEEEGRIDQTNPAPFTKKKDHFEPFASIEIKKEQGEYEKLLLNLSAEEERPEEKMEDALIKNKQLEEKLTKSILKIQKLQGELDRINRSALVGSNEFNLSMSRQNISALDISTSKIVDQKVLLEKKYAKLKQDYLKLKAAYDKIKSNSPAKDSTANNNKPQANNNEILRLNSALAAMQREKQAWKEKAQTLASELRKQKEQSQKSISKLQKKISDMNTQLQVARKSTDVMNRSQHLSMEMDEYNFQQTEILKQQNTFLMNENERLTKMCQKYKSQYKKMKETYKANSDSLLI